MVELKARPGVPVVVVAFSESQKGVLADDADVADAMESTARAG